MASSAPRAFARRSLTSSILPRGRSTTVRAASTSTVPPESPRYVDVPQPPQPAGFDHPPVKGVLPTPRKIFKDKFTGSKEYLNATSAHPTTERPVPLPSHEQLADYKARLRELRRKNLREGMRQLKQRKERSDARVAVVKKAREEERARAISRPEREEDRLTAPSVLDIKREPPSARISAEELQLRRERLAAKEAAKAEERRVNLHTLYMNARDFIVTEEQLNKKVDEVFDAPFYQNRNDPSIWRAQGIPERVSDLIDKASGRADTAMDANEGYAGITRERLQRVAEELTGGKMEDASRRNA